MLVDDSILIPAASKDYELGSDNIQKTFYDHSDKHKVSFSFEIRGFDDLFMIILPIAKRIMIESQSIPY